jgi:uncharacterized protein YdhG (YjbR/CyaY superfamily)
MSKMDEYFSTLRPLQRAEFERIRSLIYRIVPSAELGESYGMPAYMYKGKPFLSAMATKKHLSIYPFSGKVIDQLRDMLKDFTLSPGTIRFSEDHTIPEPLLREVIMARLKEIDAGLEMNNSL